MISKENVKMEDINGWVLGLMLEVTKNVDLNSIEEDKLWNDLQGVMEKNFNWPDYRNYN